MKAIVLAGGRGSRLQPWHTAKTLLPVAGVSMLERLLRHLSFSGVVDRIVVCTGYRAQDVERALEVHGWLSDEALTRVHLSPLHEDASMGTRLVAARTLADAERERVIICYGDELVDVDVRRLLEVHGSEAASMTFAAALQRVTGGVVDQRRGRVRIVEGEEVLVNVGFVVVEPECWAELVVTDGLSDWINRVGERRRVSVYAHAGKRATVNSLADLAYAEEVWA